MNDYRIKKVYRCGGGNSEVFIDYIAVQFHNRETEYIVFDKNKSVKKQVSEYIKSLKNKNDNT